MKTVKYLCCFFLLIGFRTTDPGEKFCGIKNTTTQNGEEISYTIYYAVAGVYVNAGAAVFSNNIESINGKTVYHVVGEGGSNPRYDWIYKVRDRYESYMDTLTMLPLKFMRDTHEGNHKRKEIVSFNHFSNTAKTNSGTIKVPDCIQDVQSTIYYARNIDFNQYQPGDKIPFQMFLENQVHNMYIRYLGKEKVKTKFGKFTALKFSAVLISGTIFKGGEEMKVWVTDDRNHIPVRIESPIVVGSIKADMTSYKNLRYPLSSLEAK